VGTVEKFASKRGFGFIISDSGERVFAHWSNILSNEQWPQLTPGQKVEFATAWEGSKLMAKSISGPGGQPLNTSAGAAREQRTLSDFTVQGTVHFFHHAGYGFIALDTDVEWPQVIQAGSTIYVSREELVTTPGSSCRLEKGMRVQFRLWQPESGSSVAAAEVTAIGGEPLTLEAAPRHGEGAGAAAAGYKRRRVSGWDVEGGEEPAAKMLKPNFKATGSPVEIPIAHASAWGSPQAASSSWAQQQQQQQQQQASAWAAAQQQAQYGAAYQAEAAGHVDPRLWQAQQAQQAQQVYGEMNAPANAMYGQYGQQHQQTPVWGEDQSAMFDDKAFAVLVDLLDMKSQGRPELEGIDVTQYSREDLLRIHTMLSQTDPGQAQPGYDTSQSTFGGKGKGKGKGKGGGRKKMVPCRYFQEGRCSKGEECPFLHDLSVRYDPSTDPQKRPICIFFAQGLCKKGEACTFLHDLSNATQEQVMQAFQEVRKTSTQCKFFALGLCQRGEHCTYRHDMVPSSETPGTL